MCKHLLCVLLVGLPIVLAAAPSEYPRVQSYALDVTFEPSEAMLRAKAVVTFDPASDPADTVTFYLHGETTVDSVVQAGKRLPISQELVLYLSDYSSVGNKTRIDLTGADPIQPIEIYYWGWFNPSKSRAQSNYMRICETGVYLRSYRYSVWFPVFLADRTDWYDTDFTQVILRTPEEFSSVFAGHLVGDIVENGQRISEWTAMDLPLFDAQCAAHRYDKLVDGPVNIYHWKDSASVSSAGNVLSFVQEVCREFEKRYRGSSQAPEYYVIEMPKYGEISSSNVTAITNHMWTNFDQETYPKRGLAHELVHPFVEIDIPMDDPLSGLVVESFPSFFHLPALENVLGKDWYHKWLGRIEKSYLKKKKTGLNWRGQKLSPEVPIDHITFEDIGKYKDSFILADRALLFLNYLRVNMGQERFDRFAKELTNLPGLADTIFRDFVRGYMPEIGDDLDLWLSGTDYPERLHLSNLSD